MDDKVTKKCIRCKQELPTNLFDKGRGVCKECRKKYANAYRNTKHYKKIAAKKYRKNYKAKAQEWYKKHYNKEEERTRKLRYTYRLSREDYESLILSQNNKCGICGIEMKRPFVDHCHKTEKVRGLLCVRCNLGLGAFGENTDFLLGAINYLKRFEVFERGQEDNVI